MIRISTGLAALALAMALSTAASACETAVSICEKPMRGSFSLVRSGAPAAVLADAGADTAVRHVADAFAADLQRVSGRAAVRLTDPAQAKGELVIVGVLGQSPIIDGLVASGKLKADDISGQWEAFRQIVVERPFPNVPRALVVVGADRRGAVFGTYDLSEKMGVSPWHWFADAPVAARKNLYVTAGARRDQPKVKYRGFFINDEAPALTTWAEKHFGGANSKMYAHVFELLLRMKGNYLWPAMWPPRAFNDDDPQNMILADAMGVVMGTSHHEPLTRAHDEWHRNKEGGVTGGKWDYSTNAENLRTFWRGGMERMMSKPGPGGYEAVVTVGMRGDGDEAMAEGTATQLLETIVADQRKIIAEVTGKPADQTPQIWALYKEVQDYYDHGMKVPDDVTLLFADDNWGQIRRLPTSDLDRKGGYGVYYHFDYVGAPRNYKWLNTVQIEKTWQQMDLAYQRGAKALWIVNVGDIKPVEFPLEFFMDQAWNPEVMTPEAVTRYPTQWAGQVFGQSRGAEIGELITRYSKYAARRKPELIDAGSFRLGEAAGEVLDGGEFGQMVAEWDALERDMLRVKAGLPAQYRDAYLQLVEHPVAAMANLYRLYYAVAWNRRLAGSKDPRANIFADRAEDAFKRDQALSDAYHRANGGKWDGMMTQTHIGYTIWQQPETNIMPRVERVAATGPAKPIVFAKPEAHAPAGVIAIEAVDFSRTVDGAGLGWRAIPHLGRTAGSVTALPQGRAPTTEKDAVRVEYDVTTTQGGDLTVQLYLSPTLDTTGRNSQRIGVSIDDRPMEVLIDKLLPAPTSTTLQEQQAWNEAVQDNARMIETAFADVKPGKHVIKIWRLDDNVVVQKIVAATAPIPLTYLGPPAQARR
ncbi:glycosyl hydrolase 115 family protein [Phenylobacterium deserti]|uniref:Gylcosyl hydrolase 115 C-terminal domain-containing protein n=1 Tax=Phenylobacterium deserti TaxID=1914756 RepID=A0A328AS79_9CAUL|nr:glycosyl hydrolase 115 family protein [Phenylobacterium deserti]RAK57409.1 hypothetical protein DJ018_05570 [Phenylobacterium deserti]